MISIVAVDKFWGIGKNNDLLFHLKADMQHFVACTKGKTVVMGSNTLRSLPNGMPLKNRINIVLNPDGTEQDATERGYMLAKSLQELFEILKNQDLQNTFVIGGAMMYRTLLPYCETAIITKVDADGEAQVFYDNLDNHKNWTLENEEPTIEDNGYKITFCTYRNNAPLKF